MRQPDRSSRAGTPHTLAQRLTRLLRHLWSDPADVRRRLGRGAVERVQAQVSASERRHHGEIRVCIEAGLPLAELWREVSARDRAIGLFGQLGVWDTEANNGVLIYLLLSDQAIEIVADRGLNRHVSAAHWQAIVAQMHSDFRSGQFEAGLTAAVAAVDRLLVEHFPRDAGAADVNELPDAPVLR